MDASSGHGWVTCELKKRRIPMNLSYKFVSSPIGRLKLVASDNGLVAILWEDENPRRVRLSELTERPDHPVLAQTEKELEEYFEGTRDAFNHSISRYQRNGISKTSVEGAVGDSVWTDSHLRSACKSARQPKGYAGCRCGKWSKPCRYPRAMSSCHRLLRKADWICRRARGESTSASIGRAWASPVLLVFVRFLSVGSGSAQLLNLQRIFVQRLLVGWKHSLFGSL